MDFPKAGNLKESISTVCLPVQLSTLSAKKVSAILVSLVSGNMDYSFPEAASLTGLHGNRARVRPFFAGSTYTSCITAQDVSMPRR